MSSESNQRGFTKLPIEIGDLCLRRPTVQDFDDFVEFYCDEAVARFQLFEPWTEENVAFHLQSQLGVRIGDPGVALCLAVVYRPDWKVIGEVSITIQDLETPEADIGFTMNPRYWGRRLGSIAVHSLLGFGFGRMAMHRIYALVDTRNDRSWRLMERIGMRREGHFVRWRKIKNEWIDDYGYAMLANEWRAEVALEIQSRTPTS